MTRFFILIGLLFLSCAVSKDLEFTRSLLVQQLENGHTNEDWFVPTMVAVEGLTAEQANWKDGVGNHSISELVSHLIFWNERVLIAFKGDRVPDFNDDNEITFEVHGDSDWTAATSRLDSIQSIWEALTASATESQLKKWAESIASTSAHNAYHTGQIVYIRKQKGWWK